MLSDSAIQHESGSHQRIAPNAVIEEEHPIEDRLEPIAIIGLSLKFPQDAISAETFWSMLMEGRSGRTEIPKDRFNKDAFYRTGPSRPGSVRDKDQFMFSR